MARTKKKKVVFWASVRYPEGTEPPNFKEKRKKKLPLIQRK
ncbi:hypothetical protein LCGC14_0694080 [marine sediment metagenome]|uniref:Uncharacterized protein n=1 Tax=marine sediment metagenome TaxID=412755 RepID=A0A0F9T5V0_9ZZZZ